MPVRLRCLQVLKILPIYLRMPKGTTVLLVFSQVLFDGIKKSGIGVPSYKEGCSIGAVSESQP